MENKANKLSAVLKVISNPNRLMILCLLEEKELTVSCIGQQIPNISLSAISQHLSALKLAGMVQSEKKGLQVYYRIADENVLKLMKSLKEIYCGE